MPVTIAIPFYNAEKYLLDAIKSVFAQTYQDWELILVDDGSTDNSLKIAQSINDPRVRIISDGKNLGLPSRLNQVTELAKYEYIARMDADDLMDPIRIETQREILKRNPKIDIVTTGVYSVLNNLELIGTRGRDFNEVSFDELISRKKGVTHAALMAKKSWYQRNKYDESLIFIEDLELWVRSSYNSDLNIISIKQPLYIYREEDNITASKLLKAYKNERQLIKKYKGIVNKLYIKSIFKTKIVKFLDFTNQLGKLQKKRNRAASDIEINHLKSIINKINNVTLQIHNEK